MSDAYKLKVGSLPEYEDLVAEIYINETFIAAISQEEGPGIFAFEIDPAYIHSPIKVELVALESALDEAKRRLNTLRRSPE